MLDFLFALDSFVSYRKKGVYEFDFTASISTLDDSNLNVVRSASYRNANGINHSSVSGKLICSDSNLKALEDKQARQFLGLEATKTKKQCGFGTADSPPLLPI